MKIVKKVTTSRGKTDDCLWYLIQSVDGEGNLAGLGYFETRMRVGKYPWNKGLKGIHLSPDSEFKKGNIPWIEGKTKENNDVVQKMFSEGRMGKDNPMYNKHYSCSKETKIKIGNKNHLNTKSYFIKNPEKRKQGFLKTYIPPLNQLQLFDIIQKSFPNETIELEYCPLGLSRILDIAIPKFKIDIEYDDRNHDSVKGKKNDEIRNKELKNKGWIVFRIKEKEYSDITINPLIQRIGEIVNE